MKIEFKKNIIECDDIKIKISPKDSGDDVLIYYYHNNSIFDDIEIKSLIQNRTFRAERCEIGSEYYNKVVVKITKLISKTGIKIVIYKEDDESIIYEMSDTVNSYFFKEGN